VNDNAPEMLKKMYRFKIPETQPVQEPLTQENGTAAVTAEMTEIDEFLDKKPWISFEPNDIIGPALFRVRTCLLNVNYVNVVNVTCKLCLILILASITIVLFKSADENLVESLVERFSNISMGIFIDFVTL
jgi:hypothetical protein